MPSTGCPRRDRFRISCSHRKILFPNISWPEEEEHCSQFLDELFRYYSCNHTFMPNQIRDLYYQLFNTLSASRKKISWKPNFMKSRI